MVPQIRTAEPADIPGIRGVARAAWMEAHAPIVGVETVEAFLAEHYDSRSFVDRVAREDVILDVAVAETAPIAGYVMGIEDADDEAVVHLAHIYVAPECWGNGVGQALLDHFEHRVGDRGGDWIQLGVMAENDRAVDFYERAGYDRVDSGYDERVEVDNYTYEKRLE